LRIARGAKWIAGAKRVFRGRHEHSIDAKGRTSLPARFREVLAQHGETHIVVTTGFDRCLDAYALSEWEAFEAKLAQQPQFDDKLKPLRRHYVGNAIECELDKLGRLLLPSELRERASMENREFFVGVGRRLEIWNPPLFLAENAADPQNPASFTEMKARMTELGL
jgi:MraZ protein